MLYLFAALLLQEPAPTQIPSQPSCPRCDITLTRMAWLGTKEGDGAFSTRPYVATTDSRGRYFVVTPESDDETPYVFAPNGRFLRRLGRVGAGPGEYRRPRTIMVQHDSVYIVERSNGRVTVLDPDWRYARSFNVPPGALNAALFDSGSLLVNARIRDSDRTGFPHHLFDLAGNYIRSFGDLGDAIDPRNNTVDWWWLTPSANNQICGIPYSQRYLIELYDEAGHTIRRIERHADWYPPFKDPWNVTPDKQPYPMMFGCWVDSAGLLWVIGNVSDRTWARGLGDPKPAEGRVGVYYPFADWQKLYDGIIEVIDPARNVVVTTRRFDNTLNLVVGPGVIGGVREDEEGHIFLEVLRINLLRRQ